MSTSLAEIAERGQRFAQRHREEIATWRRPMAMVLLSTALFGVAMSLAGMWASAQSWAWMSDRLRQAARGGDTVAVGSLMTLRPDGDVPFSWWDLAIFAAIAMLAAVLVRVGRRPLALSLPALVPALGLRLAWAGQEDAASRWLLLPLGDIVTEPGGGTWQTIAWLEAGAGADGRVLLLGALVSAALLAIPALATPLPDPVPEPSHPPRGFDLLLVASPPAAVTLVVLGQVEWGRLAPLGIVLSMVVAAGGAAVLVLSGGPFRVRIWSAVLLVPALALVPVGAPALGSGAPPLTVVAGVVVASAATVGVLIGLPAIHRALQRLDSQLAERSGLAHAR